MTKLLTEIVTYYSLHKAIILAETCTNVILNTGNNTNFSQILEGLLESPNWAIELVARQG